MWHLIQCTKYVLGDFQFEAMLLHLIVFQSFIHTNEIIYFCVNCSHL